MFKDRAAAGKLLAKKLVASENTIVLWLPRGGLTVAYEIAKALKSPLDLLLVKKVGAPHNEELAIAAVSIENIIVINSMLMNIYNIPHDEFIKKIQIAQDDIAQRNVKYRAGRQAPNVKDKDVIVVDDGIATGASMKAAILLLKQMQPKTIIIATPVASVDVIIELEQLVDKVVVLIIPDDFTSVGQVYKDFHQLTDEEVSSYFTLF